MTQQTFPVAGPRQPVYDYMTSLGFAMSKHSDKEWTSADGLTVNIFGAGSRARIGTKIGVAEMPLGELGAYVTEMRRDRTA